MRNKFVIFIISLLYLSCSKQDPVLDAIPAKVLNVTTDIIDNQSVFINLVDVNFDSDSFNNCWHLKFQNTLNAWSIYLNPLENVAIYQTTSTDFKAIDSNYNLVGLNWSIDIPTTKGLYPAIGEWGDFNFNNPESFKAVYIVRIKNDITADFFKLQLLDASENSYRVRYGNLNKRDENTIVIRKNEEYSHSYLELSSEVNQPLVEPKHLNWDLSFTYLADSIIKHGNQPFISTINKNYGVYQSLLINQKLNVVAIDTVVGFTEMDYFIANKLNYNKLDQLNNIFIGWNNLKNEAYIKPKTCLILKRDEDYYAVSANDLFGDYPISYSLKLIIKKL